ncbi:MerR family DNA-binding transcriptional regulator, partial [Candidatus Dependentiae bacterium]|nr:MerR family DNA-binding transcriptional regulator [Candidatus Dependentiae bacterium]
MNSFIGIGKAAKILGISTQTLRRWENEKRLIPGRTKGGQRRYDVYELQPHYFHKSNEKPLTIAYARVSSHDQKADLEVITDLGSGINYHKKGLKLLLEKIMQGPINRLVLTHKDRLFPFGAEFVFALCEQKSSEVVIINQGVQPSCEEELAQDVLEIITVFSARLYDLRSRKNKRLIDGLKQ